MTCYSLTRTRFAYLHPYLHLEDTVASHTISRQMQVVK